MRVASNGHGGEQPMMAKLNGPARMTRDSDLDAQTLEACRRGDRGAFRLVFDAYRDRVYSLALHFSGNESAAKDIAQQVFLTLFTHINQFRGKAQFATWLFRVVINACIDEHRRQRRYLPEEVAPEPAAGSNQEETCANREVAAYVQSATARLAPKLRAALLLRHLEELSYDEIAAVLGCSPGTVASRLNRAHRALGYELGQILGGG